MTDEGAPPCCNFSAGAVALQDRPVAPRSEPCPSRKGVSVSSTRARPCNEGPWADLPAEAPDMSLFKRNVAEAHEVLANLPGPAGEQFRAVAECLARAGQAEKPTPPPEGKTP